MDSEINGHIACRCQGLFRTRATSRRYNRVECVMFQTRANWKQYVVRGIHTPAVALQIRTLPSVTPPSMTSNARGKAFEFCPGNVLTDMPTQKALLTSVTS
jgi:hypothetical protein